MARTATAPDDPLYGAIAPPDLPEVAKTSYKGVTGAIAFDQYGDIRDGTLTLYTFKGGHRTVLAVTKQRTAAAAGHTAVIISP